MVAVFGVVMACGDDDDPDAATLSAIDDNSKALCEKLFSCCSQSELADLSFVDTTSPPSLSGCIALHSQNGRDYKAATDAEAAAGHISVHLDRSAACVAEVRGLSCSEFHARLVRLHLGDAFGLCNPAIVEPLVDDGAACGQYFSCKGGICDTNCKSFPAAGAACTPDQGCAEGMRCDPDTKTCKALVAKNGDCAYDDECASGACGNGKCVTPGRCGG
jgi:hypothetical protein